MRKISTSAFRGLIFAVFALVIISASWNDSAAAGRDSQAAVRSKGASAEKPAEARDDSMCTSDSAVRVVAVQNADAHKTKDAAGLGGRILVTVDCLNLLLKEKNDRNRKIALFLNDMPILGSSPEAITRNTVQFHLKRTDESKPAWNALLGRPHRYIEPVSVSVGLDNGAPVATAVDQDNKFGLVVIERARLFWWAGFMLASTLCLFVLARKSAIIRNYDAGSPFSLALTQMAFWALLIISAYIFLWLITGSADTLNGSSLTLLGIGIGTALGGRIIDANKHGSQLQELTAKIQDLSDKLKTADPNLATELTANLNTTKARIATVRAAKDIRSQNFISDILGDKDGISFHRFQMALWTIVLGVIFCASVYRDLAMPEFSETMLALVGISSGTYLGFKFPEQNY